MLQNRLILSPYLTLLIIKKHTIDDEQISSDLTASLQDAIMAFKQSLPGLKKARGGEKFFLGSKDFTDFSSQR